MFSCDYQMLTVHLDVQRGGNSYFRRNYNGLDCTTLWPLLMDRKLDLGSYLTVYILKVLSIYRTLKSTFLYFSGGSHRP